MIMSCPVCESDSAEIKAIYRGMHSTFKNLSIANCNYCGMEYATPMPDERLLSEYNANYFESAHGGIVTSVVSLAFFSAIARLRVAFVEKYLHTRESVVATVFEFGPGPGFFANAWLAWHPHKN